jgi:hypothetical protein
MKKIIAVCLFASCVAFNSSAFAATDAQKPMTDVMQNAEAEQIMDSVYTGIVEKHKDGTVLVTPEKVYPLVGGDFTMIIGKEVNVLGKVVKEDDVEKLIVSKLTEQQ